jgi:BirA family biotin operon repressor/biotin-[acetyl-CoA-carboxylase] ligase
MEVGDLSLEALADALPGRPVRAYPALLSTEADALAWARSGVEGGAVVVAGYQASPRGRGGREWAVDHRRDLCFSLVLRPDLPAEREGWIYVTAAAGLADAIGEEAAISWPDEVVADGREEPLGAVAVTTEVGSRGVAWAVVNLLVRAPFVPRLTMLASVVAAVEARSAESPEHVLADYLPRCRTIGRSVQARLVPLGPASRQIEGRAAAVVGDGALVVETAGGHRVAVRPQGLGALTTVPPA